MQPTGMVGICEECNQRIPIYDTRARLIMADHGIFEVGPGEPNITCPASSTSKFSIITDSNLGIEE